MQILPLTVGDYVRVRRERWRVGGIRSYEGCRLVDLHGTGRNTQVRKRVILPFEVVEPLVAPRRPRFVGSRRWQHECRRRIAAAGGADALHSAATASMELLPHQLEPALAIVRGVTSRVLIADDVGLGKTVQAGLIAGELIRRGAAERVLILTPAGLREQWVGELMARFRLRFTLVDAAALQQRRATLHPGTNPWTTFPLVVASLDYVKRPELLPAVARCRWDLVIVDEVHGAVTAADRRAAVARLARQAPYVVLLTATPHNGDSESFAALCRLGEHDDPLTVLRRTRRDLGMPSNRRVHRLVVQPSIPEREMHARLDAFARAVLADHAARRADAWLGLSTLYKRAISSPFALQQSVSRRLAALGADLQPLEQQLALPLVPEAEEIEDGIPRWTCPDLHDHGEERRMLSALVEAASAAIASQAKLAALRRLIRRIREPIVVFTEYRDTLIHVRHLAAPAAAVLHGGLSRSERQSALQAFDRGDCPVLLATDAAGEGLNLHRRCRIVINLELPWNPMRLEQRIGRVDRIGQRRPVHAFHLVAAATREVTMLARLEHRLARARRDIDVPDPLRSDDGVFTRVAAPLTTAAGSEYQRLLTARRLIAPDAADSDPTASTRATLISAARGRVRARIAPRALALVQTTLSDGGGQAVARHLEGLLLPVPQARHSGPSAMPSLMEAIQAALANRLGDRAWHHEAAAIHAAFWRRRATRERAIGSALTREAESPHQPGLFWPQQTQDSLEARASSANPLAQIEAAERWLALSGLHQAITLLLLP